MACFLVPAAEAVIVTVATQVIVAHEQRVLPKYLRKQSASPEHDRAISIPLSKKLRWLSNLLWGGSFLLAFEHVWHGEIVPWFPFLSTASSPADVSAMLHEMSTVGIAMAGLVTAAWVGMVLVSVSMTKRTLSPALATK